MMYGNTQIHTNKDTLAKYNKNIKHKHYLIHTDIDKNTHTTETPWDFLCLEQTSNPGSW